MGDHFEGRIMGAIFRQNVLPGRFVAQVVSSDVLERPYTAGGGGGTPGTTSSIRQLLGAADAQTAHPATSGTAPAHQRLGSANAETTPAGAPAAAADRKQRPDATCEGKYG